MAEKPVLLACGCVAMATHAQPHDGLPPNHPSCAVHFGIAEGKNCQPADQPDLTGRFAKCGYNRGRPLDRPWRNSGPIYGGGDKAGMCDNKRGGGCRCRVPSDFKLPFFSLATKPGQDDEFFCGCAGWD